MVDIWPFEEDEDPYTVEVEQDEFYDVLEDVKASYDDVLERQESMHHEPSVEVTRSVEDREQRFHPFSTRIQGPVVVVDYEVDVGPTTYATRGWASYRDRDRETALEEASLDLPEYVRVREADDMF